MARQFRTLKNTYTSGEQDPSLAIREDIKHYYNGADKLRNVIVRPQGGCDRRWGTRFIDYLWPNIVRLDHSGFTATAPNGGTANNAKDDTGIPGTVVTTTNNISTTDPYVVIHYDCGAAVSVCSAEIRNAILTNLAGTTSSEFFIQYSTDNVSWTSLGQAVAVLNGTNYTNQRRSATPRNTQISARYWRFARIGGTDLSTTRISISDFILRGMQVPLSQGYKLIPIDYDASTKYMLVMSDDNTAVYKDETWETDVRSSHDGSDLAELNWCQSFDTVFLFFEDESITRLIRAGDDHLWNSAGVDFETAPVYQFTDTPQPGAITLDPSATTGNGINLIASSAFFTSDMVDWQFELPLYKGSGGGVFRSTAFTNSTTLVGDVLEDFASVATAVPNAVVREPAFTSTRGYPRGGVFHEGRFILFNHPLAPNVFWASRVGLPFNFDDSQSLDDFAFVYDLTGDNPPRIYAMNSGRHLQIFGNASEFYVLPNDTQLTPQLVVAKHTTDSGSQRLGLRPISVEGATLFVRKGGVEVDEFIFADTEQAYQADPVSLLSSHLLNDVVQIFVKPSTQTAETNQVYMVNGDGTLACMATLRRQDVTAFSKLITDGEFLQGEVVGDKIYLCVERSQINSNLFNFLEVADPDSLTDCGLRGTITYETYTATAAQTVFTWVFTDPASADLVGVIVDGVVLTYGADYTVTLGSNTVTLIGDYAAGLEAGQVVTLHQLVATLTVAHLPDTLVEIITDGAVQAQQTTTAAGVVTPDPLPYFEWEVGLRFPDVRTDENGVSTGMGDQIWVRDMPIAADLPDGTLVGETKRVFEVSAEVITTGDLWIGANGEEPVLCALRNFDINTLNVVEPYTGPVVLEAILGADKYGRVEFTQRSSAKLTLLGSAKKVAI